MVQASGGGVCHGRLYIMKRTFFKESVFNPEWKKSGKQHLTSTTPNKELN